MCVSWTDKLTNDDVLLKAPGGHFIPVKKSPRGELFMANIAPRASFFPGNLSSSGGVIGGVPIMGHRL